MACTEMGEHKESLTLRNALHELSIRLKPPWAGMMALAMQEVQSCSTAGAGVPCHTHLTAH